MPGVKLRSEKVEQFDALGERGQPVYKVAPQILAVLKRWDVTYPGVWKTFALPQANQDGSQIDWYAAEEGDVVAWSAASTEERDDARQKLVGVQQSVAEIQARTQVATQGQSGDGALFGKLLTWIIHHPDTSYLYLVNNTPVITFWGFLHNGADRKLDPLHALFPAAPTVPLAAAQLAPSAPVAPAFATPVINVRSKWWKRWWFWLGLALLGGALLFGLRACMPKAALPTFGTPAMNLPTGSRNVTTEGDRERLQSTGRGNVVELTSPKDTAISAIRSGVATDANKVASTNEAASGLPLTPTSPNMAPEAPKAPSDAAPQALSDQTPASLAQPTTPPELPAGPDPISTPPALQTPAQTPSPAGTPLVIPADVKDGDVNFLNGKWRAGAGIQDRNTGAPLRLQYEFEKGVGQVRLDRQDGVQCTAPVSAKMQGHSMSIANTKQADCSDGSVYELPKVNCSPNAENVADCVGSYGDSQFSMSMRQNNP